MSELTVYASGESGDVRCWGATYSDVRTGAATLNAYPSATNPRVGQIFVSPNYFCYEICVEFDTSSIPADATIDSAVLSWYAYSDHSATDFTIKAYVSDWGGTLTTADYVSGASLSGLTQVASVSTSGMTESQYHTMTDVAVAANIVKAGTTRFIFASSRHENGDTPTGEEYYYGDSANPVRLVINYTSGQTLLPDADTVTTGWSTAPLYSKVNATGGDVITATSS